MILCDTNIIIEIYRNNASIIADLKAIGQKNIAFSKKLELYTLNLKDFVFIENLKLFNPGK